MPLSFAGPTIAGHEDRPDELLGHTLRELIVVLADSLTEYDRFDVGVEVDAALGHSCMCISNPRA